MSLKHLLLSNRFNLSCRSASALPSPLDGFPQPPKWPLQPQEHPCRRQVLPPRLPFERLALREMEGWSCASMMGSPIEKFTIIFSWVTTFIDNDLELGGVFAASLFVLLVVVNVHLIATCGRLSFFPKHVFDRHESLLAHSRQRQVRHRNRISCCRRGCVHRMDRRMEVQIVVVVPHQRNLLRRLCAFTLEPSAEFRHGALSRFSGFQHFLLLSGFYFGETFFLCSG